MGKEEKTLLDWIENGMFPMSVKDLVLHRYTRYTLQFSNHKIGKRIIKWHEILATSLFLTLLKQTVPRPPEQIAFVTGVSDDRILKIAVFFLSKTKDHMSLNKSLLPSVWIPLLASEMHLTFKEKNQLSKFADCMQQYFSFSPISVLLGSAYALFSNNNHIIANRSELSKVGGISLPTLKKAIDAINKQWKIKFEKNILGEFPFP